MRDRAAFAQGLYYVVTGLWPFFHLRSFLAVTGPKRDIWLVRTVGALAAAIGIPLLRGESRTLATTSALAFGAVDAGYVAVGRISPVYLCDMAAQAGFLALGGTRRP
jgi:hypothetical protein